MRYCLGDGIVYSFVEDFVSFCLKSVKKCQKIYCHFDF
ncbi:hypothetical protein HH_0747 [Helicobacter hepaticus ATCC 51449]|uniref:Uncharacterized protein n=1 Tax=Helicobacter hepaticus (strain ATCC 51449 / 3B1) TaxID=235279 RepID=Q7VI61_HELHP|nr:hypothetical protein HH_0747 [Helicobacter hepaticus ATCC 51449]